MPDASQLRPVPPARPSYWLGQVAGWGVWCAFGLLIARQQMGGFSPGLISGYALFWGYSIGLTHLLRRIIHRHDWLALPPAAAVARLGGAAVTLGLTFTALVTLVSVVQFGSASSFLTAAPLAALAANPTFAAVLWTTLYAGLATWLQHRAARQRAAALERSLATARLQALEAQMNPHFLFNCLNSLRGMIAEDPAHAQDMVTRLANILRHNLTRRADPTTESLAAQVAVVEDYLALEAVRFDERLRWRITIDPAAAACMLPAMALPTLVENAIKHGIAHLPAGGEVEIDVRRDGEHIDVRVENSGSLRPSPAASTRVGLANLRERVRMLHGAAGTLELSALPNERVRARLRLPATRHPDTTGHGAAVAASP